MNDLLDMRITKQKTLNVQAAWEMLRKLWAPCTNYNDKNYGEDGARLSDWIPPKGYHFKTYYEEDINYEVLKPSKPNGKYMIMIHGGGYSKRMLDCFIDFMPLYSQAAGNATVVNIDYRVVPYVKCTDLILDVVKGYQMMLKRQIAPSDIIMVGDSSGGGTVMSAGLYMRDHGMPMPAGIISISGSMDLGMTTESCKANDGKDLCFHSSETLHKLYSQVLDGEDYRNPYISPYYGDYHGMSPLMLIVGGDELLADDSINLAETASSQGVPVRLDVYEGMFHDFALFKGKLPEADLAWKNIRKFIQACYSE